jgi:hypothetical protein
VPAPGDGAQLLQLSKDIRSTVLPAIQTLRVPRRHDPTFGPLLRLLQQLHNVQHLAIDIDMDDESKESEEGQERLVQAFGDGPLGGQLRSLRLPYLETSARHDLIDKLEAGRLPLLTEIELLFASGTEWLTRALEARRDLGLPPLTRLPEVLECDMIEEDCLHRLWACCPSHLVAHLEANGGRQVAALGEYLLAHPDNFLALPSLSVGGGMYMQMLMSSAVRVNFADQIRSTSDLLATSFTNLLGRVRGALC